MSQWHREHPELAGTEADPWMQNEDYRKIVSRIPTEEEREDARLEELDDGWNTLPRASRRCFDCGVGSGPCQCTREFELWEQEQERRDA